MPNFDIVKTSSIESSFRNDFVIGKFDLQSNQISERFCGNILFPEDWKIGLIIGPSGTGKSTIANQIFSDSVFNHKFGCKSVFEEMPKNRTCEQIVDAFIGCGFSSPTSWLKPFHVLSNGEKMRTELAYCLLSDSEMIAFDEFTSVVDRVVAKTMCVTISKAINKSDKKFIAISCHHDIVDWISPDWVFDTETMTQIDVKKKDQNSDLKYEKIQASLYGQFLKSITI